MNFNDFESRPTSPLGDGTAPGGPGSQAGDATMGRAAGAPHGVDPENHDFDESDDAHDAALALSGSSAARRLNSGVILVLLVVVVAIISLFAMRSLSRATAGALSVSDIEKMVDEFVKQRTGRNAGDGADADAGAESFLAGRDETLLMLDHDYTKRQVALSDIQKNPFILEQTRVQPNAEGDPAADRDALLREYERQREQRREAIAALADKLTLHAVLMGSNPMAKVNGTHLRRGESLVFEAERVQFIVRDITNNAVALVGVDPRYDVEVEITIYMRTP